MGPIQIATGMKITGMFSNYADESFMIARPSIIFIVLYCTGIPTILSFTPNYRTWIDFLVRHFYLLPGHVQVLGGRHTHYQSTILHRE